MFLFMPLGEYYIPNKAIAKLQGMCVCSVLADTAKKLPRVAVTMITLILRYSQDLTPDSQNF